MISFLLCLAIAAGIIIFSYCIWNNWKSDKQRNCLFCKCFSKLGNFSQGVVGIAALVAILLPAISTDYFDRLKNYFAPRSYLSFTNKVRGQYEGQKDLLSYYCNMFGAEWKDDIKYPTHFWGKYYEFKEGPFLLAIDSNDKGSSPTPVLLRKKAAKKLISKGSDNKYSTSHIKAGRSLLETQIVPITGALMTGDCFLAEGIVWNDLCAIHSKNTASNFTNDKCGFTETFQKEHKKHSCPTPWLYGIAKPNCQ